MKKTTNRRPRWFTVTGEDVKVIKKAAAKSSIPKDYVLGGSIAPFLKKS